MREIFTTTGERSLVDDEDYERISSMKWYMAGSGYPIRNIIVPGRPQRKYSEGMHRTIMNLEIGDKRHVDHINGDHFDNRRSNLRVCEPIENWWNAKKRSDNTSGFKGVSWSKSNSKWCARIKKFGKRVHLGYFGTAEAAHEAYCAAAKDLHGEFANYGHSKMTDTVSADRGSEQS